MSDVIYDYLSRIAMSVRSMSGITINDIFDILIVAYIVYQVMLWMKRTRTWSLLKGIAMFSGVYGIALLLNFNTMTWLIENTYNVGLIALIVIFQPELRRVLEQIGRGKVISTFMNTGQNSDAAYARTANEIVEAVKAMSSVRTGALILVQNDVALGDHEQTGIPIDAVVSRQLLINIFRDNTPLHDGAVIIRDNRVAAATCLLPLTQGELSHDLGTRHRAAVGASEVSDALVIVVSEETGAISVAQEGTLYRGLTPEQLRARLTENFTENKKKLLLWKGRGDNDEQAE